MCLNFNTSIIRNILLYIFFFNYTPTPEIYTFPYTTLFRSSQREAHVSLQTLTQHHRQRGSRIGLVSWYKTNSDRKSTRLNSSHRCISYAVFCLKKKKTSY